MLFKFDEDSFLIDCDSLSSSELHCLARLASRGLKFKFVVGVSGSGSKIASMFDDFSTDDKNLPILIVDSFLDTGKSMEEAREYISGQHPGSDIIGLVIFAKDECPDWVTPIFQMSI